MKDGIIRMAVTTTDPPKTAMATEDAYIHSVVGKIIKQGSRSFVELRRIVDEFEEEQNAPPGEITEAQPHTLSLQQREQAAEDAIVERQLRKLGIRS